MTHDIVTAVYCLDAAAQAARARARKERSVASQEFAATLVGLCAQLVSMAAAAGHSQLIDPSPDPDASMPAALAKCARLMSDMPVPDGVKPRMWSSVMFQVQSAARESLAEPVTIGKES